MIKYRLSLFPALKFGSALAILVVALPAYWVLSRLALQTSAPTVWLRRLLITLIPAVVTGNLLFIAAGTDDAARNTVTGLLPGSVPTVVSSLVGDVAAQFTLFLSAASVTLAAYTVVVPAIRTARDIQLSTWTTIRRAGRFALILTVLLTVVFVPFGRIVTGEDLGVAPVTLILLVLLFPFVASVLFRIFRSTRAPTSKERDRIEALCTRASLDVDDARILTDATETLEIHLRGRPGRPHVYVSASVLERFDDETLSALLAVNGGDVAHHHRAIKHYSLLAFLVVGVATLAWASTLGYPGIIGLALVGWLPVLWAARRAVRRGDDDATDRIGATTVADTLERMATEQNLDIPSGGVGTIFKSRPRLGDRINRLRKQDR